jgi:hypothetical protein
MNNRLIARSKMRSVCSVSFSLRMRRTAMKNRPRPAAKTLKGLMGKITSKVLFLTARSFWSLDYRDDRDICHWATILKDKGSGKV